MAPALTKTLKDGHGIHLSSPLASVSLDSDGGAMLNVELEPEAKMTEDDYFQKMWLSLSLLPFLDSCLPEIPGLSPIAAQDAQCKALLLPDPGSLLSLPSLSKSQRESHQAALGLPGVPDMFLVPVPEHSGSEAGLLCGPDGGDVPHLSPPPLTSLSPFPHEDPQPGCRATLLTPPPKLTQGEAGRLQTQAGQGGSGDSDRSEPAGAEVLLEEAGERRLCRQAGLLSRAERLQKRLRALLGQHTLQHCSQQLDGLKRQLQAGGASSCSSDPQPPLPSLEELSELWEFSCGGRAALRGLQEALDSEATASSSSDEEPEEEHVRRRARTFPSSSSSSSGGGGGGVGSELRWLQERAELGSRWSWLLLRVAELEGRIQQLGKLHRHIRASKGGVVLAQCQPLTDRQIQQTLLRETAGLSFSVGASDGDAEPSSPMRLLRNIERQSAQLSQIVNSLMPPLSLSPLSKQPQACTAVSKRASSSGQSEDGLGKRRRLGGRRSQQLLQADASCVCARTRPLLTYHKPRLFSFHSHGSGGQQDLESSSSTLSSSFSSSCSSCDPLCSDPACSSGSPLTSSTLCYRPHPVLSLSCDTPLSYHLQSALAREEWAQRPLVVNAQPSSSGPGSRPTHSSTPLHNSHSYKHHARHRREGVRGVSPIEWAGSAQMPHRRANQRKRKRRHRHSAAEDEEDVLYHLCDPEGSSEETLEETQASHTRKPASQGFVRRRQGESVFSIDNIVIPTSLAAAGKVEKLQYKDIVTPSWRPAHPPPLMKGEEEEDKVEVEDLSDEVFTQRHLASEQREKLRWSSWGKRQRCRRPTRSGSRPSGGREGSLAAGEESSVESSCSPLDTEDPLSSEEWQPPAPWEPRRFPLAEEEEDDLCSEEEQAPAKWSDTSTASSSSSSCSSSSSTINNPSSDVSLGSCCGAAAPSAGQSRSSSVLSSS
ncbi:KAT8 regulatory NSL complex subunit 1-like protein isoform X2 [Myripristis murdjan]|uniref:KAT8 regulatory NSL complex subunit 1-like n=1 Tax=Myripristis murdjan TaxID=586833 RepID=A0A668AID5_9TELE|nr:KAT8 regulatory NSL complex subunit 1-like protein isoform X2 [Myripristis murdjan]